MQYRIRDLLLVVVVAWVSMALWGTAGLFIGFALAGCVFGIRFVCVGGRVALVGRGIALFVVVLIVLGMTVVPLSPADREERRRCPRIDHLKAISCELHNYLDIHGQFPPAYVADEHDNRLHGWRLPIGRTYLISDMCEDIYKRYNFDEPWDSPNNRKLESLMPRCLRCPNGEKGSWITNVVAVTGPGTMWPDGRAGKWSDISSPSSTIMLIEIDDSEIHWMEPRDITIDELLDKYYVPGRGIQGHRVPFDVHGASGASYVATADGAIHLLSEDLKPEEIRELCMVSKKASADGRELDFNGSPEERPETARMVSVVVLVVVLVVLGCGSSAPRREEDSNHPTSLPPPSSIEARPLASASTDDP